MQGSLMHHYSYGFNLLPQAFKDNGLVNVLQDVFTSDRVPETRREFSEMNVRACVGWARWTQREGKSGVWSEPEPSKLEALAKQEIAAGVYVRYEIHVCIGFKNTGS